MDFCPPSSSFTTPRKKNTFSQQVVGNHLVEMFTVTDIDLSELVYIFLPFGAVETYNIKPKIVRDGNAVEVEFVYSSTVLENISNVVHHDLVKAKMNEQFKHLFKIIPGPNAGTNLQTSISINLPFKCNQVFFLSRHLASDPGQQHFIRGFNCFCGRNEENSSCNIFQMCLMRTRDNFVANFSNTRMNVVMMNTPNRESQHGQNGNQSFAAASNNINNNYASQNQNNHYRSTKQSHQYHQTPHSQSSKFQKGSKPLKTNHFKKSKQEVFMEHNSYGQYRNPKNMNEDGLKDANDDEFDDSPSVNQKEKCKYEDMDNDFNKELINREYKERLKRLSSLKKKMMLLKKESPSNKKKKLQKQKLLLKLN